ncbi:MAG: hypothetical protein A2V63_12670 [Candidatus Eisenbacteria bacterium RBG_19FT_COMBO_70_11]|nr:MAG: hypothetical protein A2V63_12670 [Candidatus Eisenbacteria bacterium RBG_19FT_COMBO_70_11]
MSGSLGVRSWHSVEIHAGYEAAAPELRPRVGCAAELSRSGSRHFARFHVRSPPIIVLACAAFMMALETRLPPGCWRGRGIQPIVRT